MCHMCSQQRLPTLGGARAVTEAHAGRMLNCYPLYYDKTMVFFTIYIVLNKSKGVYGAGTVGDIRTFDGNCVLYEGTYKVEAHEG